MYVAKEIKRPADAFPLFGGSCKRDVWARGDVAKRLAAVTMTHPRRCAFVASTDDPDDLVAARNREPKGPGHVTVTTWQGKSYAVVTAVTWELLYGCAKGYPPATAFAVNRWAHRTTGVVPAVVQKQGTTMLGLVARSASVKGAVIGFCATQRKSAQRGHLPEVNLRYALESGRERTSANENPWYFDPWLFPAGSGLLANEPGPGEEPNAELYHRVGDDGADVGEALIRLTRDVPAGAEVTVLYTDEAQTGYEGPDPAQRPIKRIRGEKRWFPAVKSAGRVTIGEHIMVSSRRGKHAVTWRQATVYGGISDQFLGTPTQTERRTSQGKVEWRGAGLLDIAASGLALSVAMILGKGSCADGEVARQLPRGEAAEKAWNSVASQGGSTMKARIASAAKAAGFCYALCAAPTDWATKQDDMLCRVSSLHKAQWAARVNNMWWAVQPTEQMEPVGPVSRWRAFDELGITAVLWCARVWDTPK